jgi:putative transposase
MHSLIVSRNPHHPPHWHVDDCWYFITASTYKRCKAFESAEVKAFAIDKLLTLATEFGCGVAAWVILDEHLHILVHLPKGNLLTLFLQRWHGAIAHYANTRDNTRGRRVFQNFWDTCMRSERDFWTRFNYIHANPVKHGYTSRMSEYPHSSFNQHRQSFGDVWMRDVLARYPVRALGRVA